MSESFPQPESNDGVDPIENSTKSEDGPELTQEEIDTALEGQEEFPETTSTNAPVKKKVGLLGTLGLMGAMALGSASKSQGEEITSRPDAHQKTELATGRSYETFAEADIKQAENGLFDVLAGVFHPHELKVVAGRASNGLDT